jgi:signal transduction histidine kinase
MVEDNGIGFPADKKEKIFTMFKRLHTHVEGTGIGLFIVKRIIDNTGSRIEVESTPGMGTTFKIYLRQE